MTKRILLGCVIVLASAGLSCKLFRGSSSSQCSLPCQVGTTYDIQYLNGNCPAREIRGVTCFGFLNFPKDCQGTCNVRAFPRRFFGFNLTASPDSADLNSPPTSITVSGQAMDGTYGLPRVEYLDSDGYLIGSVYATSVSGDGTWLVAQVPDLSSAYTGTFTIQVSNMTSEGYHSDVVGTATLNCWGRNRPDSDGDGWYDDEECFPYDSTRWDCYIDGGGGGGGDGGCIDWCNVY
jgi:hypothetical protein